MNHPLTHLLAALLVFFCLAAQPSFRPGARQNPVSTSQVSQDPSTWQLVSLTGKGIRFKLPQDWRHDGLDMESVKEAFTFQEIDWNGPNKTFPNPDKIRIFTTVFHHGFLWFGHPMSREEMIENRLDQVTTSARRGDLDYSYSEVKTVKVSGVNGVFRLMRANSKDNDMGSRLSLQWNGFRVYQGKGEEIEVTISSGAKGEVLLRTVFSTLELEQDTK